MIISKVILTEDYRVHLATTDTVGRPSHWGWFAIHSIANVYAFAQSFSVRPKNRRQLHNAIENANIAQDGLTGAAIDTSFLTDPNLHKTIQEPEYPHPRSPLRLLIYCHRSLHSHSTRWSAHRISSCSLRHRRRCRIHGRWSGIERRRVFGACLEHWLSQTV